MYDLSPSLHLAHAMTHSQISIALKTFLALALTLSLSAQSQTLPDASARDTVFSFQITKSKAPIGFGELSLDALNPRAALLKSTVKTSYIQSINCDLKGQISITLGTVESENGKISINPGTVESGYSIRIVQGSSPDLFEINADIAELTKIESITASCPGAGDTSVRLPSVHSFSTNRSLLIPYGASTMITLPGDPGSAEYALHLKRVL